jgi:hypothetical protein
MMMLIFRDAEVFFWAAVVTCRGWKWRGVDWSECHEGCKAENWAGHQKNIMYSSYSYVSTRVYNYIYISIFYSSKRFFLLFN